MNNSQPEEKLREAERRQIRQTIRLVLCLLGSLILLWAGTSFFYHLTLGEPWQPLAFLGIKEKTLPLAPTVPFELLSSLAEAGGKSVP